MQTILTTNIDCQLLLDRFQHVRKASLDMVLPLPPEALRLQPMADVSPPWWNLAHTSWFFARNVLREFGAPVTPEDELYDYLLNSYYESLGPRLPRDKRGSVSRPTNDEVFEYRSSVDRRVQELVEAVPADRAAELARVLEIGIQHEQQHQELFFTEIKYILAQTPPLLRQTYQVSAGPEAATPTSATSPTAFHEFDGGLFNFGHLGDAWCWDNELPVHKFYLHPFALADRLVTCGITREFNFNLLDRMNRELGADFDRNGFDHEASYNTSEGCMQSHLISRDDQLVTIGSVNRHFRFASDERVHVESSYKYDLPRIEQFAANCGFQVRRHFFDRRAYFTNSLWEAID